MKRVSRLTGLIWLGVLFSLNAFAQSSRLSENPEQFLGDLQKLMITGGPVALKAERNLESLWTENHLSATQQGRIISLSRKMNQKRYQPMAHFVPLFESLYHAVYTQKPAATPAELDNLLLVAEKLFDANDPKAFTKAMETARLFLERREVYASNFNRLYVVGGTFSFTYLDKPLAAGEPSSSEPVSATAALPASATASTASRFDGWDDPVPGDSGAAKPLGRLFIPQRRPIPAVSGAVLSFREATLIMTAPAVGDSVALVNTSGSVMLKEGILVGRGGKFTWELVGRPDIFAVFTEYSLTTMNPRLSADDVTLTYNSAKPIKGVFEYVAKKRSAGQASTYPRFMSWQNDVVMPGLGTDLDYRGGLALSGLQLVGASASGQPALLTVKQGGKAAFRVRSPRFTFADSTIAASTAQFTGYLAQDSITHPAVQFRFDRAQRVAWLNRLQRSAYERVPFSDTYHKFFIQPEVVRWDLPRKKVDFYQIGAKREVPVRLESFDYFQPQRYADIAFDYGFHPLQIAGNYISTKKTQTFLPEDLAQFARLPLTSLNGALDRMVLEGYIDKDANTGLMRLSRKGVLYVLANAQKRDYDNFQIQSLFASNDSTKNATINLTDNLLTVRGVNRFVISDSLKIYGIPSDKTLRIGKGRTFTLNGQLKAGTFRYAGRDLSFDYDKFSMNLNKIDSITFTSQKLAAQGKAAEIGGDIKYEKPGTVYFGSADNRSGRVKDKKTTQRLVMPEGMTVYFNQPARGNLTYNTKVYFKIPAIDNDSLGKGDISFVGTFYSDGIFPPFKAELKTMPDNTLGFMHKAPATGYPVYSVKKETTPSNLKFTGDLVMDKSGLHAQGVLNHLSASFDAQQVLLMPDSLIASGTKGNIREGLVNKVYFPKVEINDYSLRWLPKQDSMVVTTQKNNVNFYNGTTKLEGNLVMRSSGLFGKGTLRRNDSEAESPNIKFNKEGFLASNARFKIISDASKAATTETRPMLLGNDLDVDFNQVKGLVNLAINKAKEQTIADTVGSSMEFPFAAYKTNISRAQWNMTAKTIAMKGDVKTSTFTATADQQEGLIFNGAAALYDVEKMALNISGVPYINSADARIYPDKGLVAIKRNGEMTAFKNARLELDTITFHHKLKNGNIQVLSRTRFSGDATYQFATAASDTTSIKMGSFELKEAPVLTADASSSRSSRRKNGKVQPTASYFTMARAEVDEADNMLLAPRMQFKGNITMQAPDKDLALDGFLKPVLKKRPDLVSGWIPFKEKIETFEINVNDKLKNEGDQPLVAGIHYRIGSAGLYPTFLSPKEDSKDEDIFRATGLMRYDEKEKVFRIVPKGTDNLEDTEGAFTFNDPKGIMTFKGRMKLMNTTPNEYLLASGSARVNVDSTQYRLNTLLAFTFPMAEPLTAAIAAQLVKTNLEEKNDESADDDLNRLSDKMLPLIGQKAVDDYRTKAQNQHVSLATASPKLNATLVLANANLRWSDKFNSFYSIGQLGVSNMLNTDINAQMDGYVEIRKGINGDEASVYLEASSEVWVFYDYKPSGTSGGQLAIVTSEQELNDRLTAGAKNAKATLEIVPATEDEKTLFVDRYLDQYKTRPKQKKPAPTPKPAATPALSAESTPDPAPTETTATAATTADPTPAATRTKVSPKAAKARTVAKAKETPKEKEKKKDKEDEKEGF